MEIHLYTPIETTVACSQTSDFFTMSTRQEQVKNFTFIVGEGAETSPRGWGAGVGYPPIFICYLYNLRSINHVTLSIIYL